MTKIPKEVSGIIKKLNESGFEAYIVGGCVRDLLTGKTPKDWDVTTNAKPEEVQKIFDDSFYENDFGTVGVKTESEDSTLKVVEVTTYRIESKYSDKRHPDEIKFASKIEEDLARRDFTINALAMDSAGKIVDLFDGQKDLKSKIVRAVGDPKERFAEDALRMLRAVRFATVMDFAIEAKTIEAIKGYAKHLADISKERIQDEFSKTIMADHADQGMELLRETGLLEYVVPEMLEGVDVGQNKHHVYTVWEHNTKALRYACDQKYSLAVRLASLFHDVAKPRCKRGEGPDSTFYNHEVVGAKMANQIMKRLKYPTDLTEKVTKLVRWHLFYYNPEEVTESSVRRLVANIGKENVEDIIKVREADRIGSGVPKARPYKLRHLQFVIDKVSRQPISLKMLKLNGDELMELLNLEPSPKIGMILNALMKEVLDDPEKNTKEYLENRAGKLNELSEKELLELGQEGKEKLNEEEEKEVEKIKGKYYVK